MSLLEYNEIKPRKIVIMDGEPYEVLTSHVFRKQQRKPVNATKLKNILTGKVMEYSFHQSEKAEEAEIGVKPAKYLYNHRDEVWFANPANPSERFKLTAEETGAGLQFMKPNSVIELKIFNEKVIGLKLPIKVELKVKEAPPTVKGNTVQGGTKVVTLETGASVNTPMFVSEGDTIVVNTDTGEYVERK